MGNPAVFNASPLIFLAEAGQENIARLAGSPLQVPKAVVEEIERFGPSDPTSLAIRRWDWLAVVDPGPAPAIIERWDLGRGETAVLTWAYTHPGTTAILDDLAARRCATSLGLPVRGTLGLLLIAKQRGVIPEARPVLNRLRAAGMYLSDRVANRALRMIGE